MAVKAKLKKNVCGRESLKLGPNLGHPRIAQQHLCPQKKTGASVYVYPCGI